MQELRGFSGGANIAHSVTVNLKKIPREINKKVG
jgi:predicted esterase